MIKFLVGPIMCWQISSHYLIHLVLKLLSCIHNLCHGLLLFNKSKCKYVLFFGFLQHHLMFSFSGVEWTCNVISFVTNSLHCIIILDRFCIKEHVISDTYVLGYFSIETNLTLRTCYIICKFSTLLCTNIPPHNEQWLEVFMDFISFFLNDLNLF